MKINKINIIYGVILSGLLIYFVHSVKSIYPLIIGNNVFVCDSCLNSIFPFIQKILAILAVFAFSNLLISYFKTIRFKKNLLPIYPTPKIIKSLEEKYSLNKEIIIFNDFGLLAFCLGILKPKIYLSSQLLKNMTRPEIEAIILHEKQHMVGKDNLLLFFLNLIKTGFFFFPVVVDFVNSIEIHREISADRGVVKETGNKISLISALRKVINSPKPSVVFAHAFSENASIEPRIRSLVGKKNRWLSLKYSSVFISLSVLLFLVNITLSRIEIHPQVKSATMLCFDKGTCQNTCQ